MTPHLLMLHTAVAALALAASSSTHHTTRNNNHLQQHTNLFHHTPTTQRHLDNPTTRCALKHASAAKHAAAAAATPAAAAKANPNPRSRHPFLMAAAAAEKETFQFEAEVAKVMDIIINSLYSDKDIFLRELISNASDACDKKRFLSLTDDKSGAYEGRVRVIADKEAKTLTIEDNGIGMSRKDLQNNLGKIAQSGTKKFTEALGSSKSDVTNLIGQFGVGFYSAFLVADRVTVVTKAEGEAQLRWESEQAATYTISTDDSEPIESSGTRLTLHLKEAADNYAEDYTLRDLLKRYSEFISFPIELWTEKTEYETVPDPDAEPPAEGEEPKTKSVPKTTNVWEKVNAAKPLWMRPPKEVTKEEYDEFYKATFKAYDTPDAYTHFSLEGQVEFRAMLFLPSAVPWELSQDMFNDKVKPIRLFVKRVFISDAFEEQLLPRWLSFLKGVVDSDDLPLNVSRELLQKSKVLSIISKRLVSKALDMFKSISEDEEKFKTFNSNFGRYVKVGVIEDRDNKEKLLKIASFVSTESGDGGTTLPAYKARMKEGQKAIYYISASSKAAAASSPVLEGLRKKGYEVIVAIDQIDEIALQGVGKYDDIDVLDAAKESADDDAAEQSDEEKAAAEEKKKEYETTTAFLKEALGDQVDKVEVSTRLTASPSALVQPQWGMSPQMQRFMKAQAAAAGGDDMMMGAMAANLELNPTHPVVLKLKAMVDAGDTGDEAKAFGTLLYEVAAVASGYELKDPTGFAGRIVLMMADADAMAKFQEEVDAAAPPPPPAAPAEEAELDISKLVDEVASEAEAIVPEVTEEE